MKSLLIIILLLSFSMQVFASEEHNPIFEKNWTLLATLQSQDMQESFKLLTELDIDIAGVDIDSKMIDVLINEHDYKALGLKGIDLTIMQTKGISVGPDDEYKNPEEIEEILNDFAARFPDITEVVSIGKSLEGRDIWAMKISDNAKIDEIDEPSILFNSMHHAREVMSPETSLDIIETLLKTYATDADTMRWVNSYEIWVIPMFNVDGNNKMWNHDKWWRKNNRGGYGVDLNRNYPSGWNSCNGSSGDQNSQTYRGPQAASEPETQAMMNFVAKVRPVFDISYHSYSELVIYPKGCKPDRAATADVVEKIGKEIATKIKYKAGTAWELLYNADGGDIDWMYEAYQVIPYVIELNSRWQGFQPKYSKWRDKTVQRNRPAWMHLLNRMDKSGIRGQVTMNNIAVSEYQIEIYKLGKVKTLYQTYMGHTTGMYHLVLNPGEYELIFKQDGNIIQKLTQKVGADLAQVDVAL